LIALIALIGSAAIRGAFDLFGGVVVESAALHDGGRRCGVESTRPPSSYCRGRSDRPMRRSRASAGTRATSVRASLRLMLFGVGAPDAQDGGVWLMRCLPVRWLQRNGRPVVLDALATVSDLMRTVAV
jgi:hypothetical protein